MTIVKTFEPQTESRFSKKYIFLAIAFLLTLTVVEIWASNTAVNYGEKYERLSLLKKNLQLENQVLENQIADVGSLKSIASKSAQLGFSPNFSIQYIR